jgi:GT2 family glycosyltransferase
MQTSATTDVTVILVGLNSRDYVSECLDSLQAAEWLGHAYEIIYVDNASTDGTVEMLAERFGHVKVIANSRNVGFCKAANQGAREAQSRHFCFINDDTIVINDAIAMLVDTLDRMPDVGTIGSRLLYPDGSEQWSGRRFPGPINGILGRRSILTKLLKNTRVVRRYLCADELKGDAPFEIDWVSAAGQLVRRETFEQVGGFAEDYYYWHEAVFCDRIRRAGKKVLLHPLSKIIHHEGKGSGTRTYQSQKFHIVDFHRGAYRCYCDHHELGRFHPKRVLAALALGTRALLLLLICWIRMLWKN